jgi:hypothetical protein
MFGSSDGLKEGFQVNIEPVSVRNPALWENGRLQFYGITAIGHSIPKNERLKWMQEQPQLRLNSGVVAAAFPFC